MASELKQLLEQITRSYEAAQRALSSPTIMAPHQFINKRMEEIEIVHAKIKDLVGDEFKATDLVVRHLAMIDEHERG